MAINLAEYNGTRTLVINEGVATDIPRKADLSFEYDAYMYSESVKYKVVGDVATELSESEIVSILAFMESPTIPEVATDGSPVEPTAEDVRLAANIAARDFLNSTDWFITRERDSGKAVPTGVKELRQGKRDSIVD